MFSSFTRKSRFPVSFCCVIILEFIPLFFLLLLDTFISIGFTGFTGEFTTLLDFQTGFYPRLYFLAGFFTIFCIRPCFHFGIIFRPAFKLSCFLALPLFPLLPQLFLWHFSILEFYFYIIIYTRGTRAIGYITRFADAKIALSSWADWGDFLLDMVI